MLLEPLRDVPGSLTLGDFLTEKCCRNREYLLMLHVSGSVEDGGKPGAARQWYPWLGRSWAPGVWLECHSSAATTPRVSVDPASSLGGLSGPKPQDFQPIWGVVCWDEFPTVSLPSCWSQGTWGEDGQMSPVSPCCGHSFGLLAPSAKEVMPRVLCGPSYQMYGKHLWAWGVGYTRRGYLWQGLPWGGRAGGAAFEASSSQQLFSRGLAEAGLAVPFPPAFYLNKLSSVEKPPLHGTSPTWAM